MPSPAGDGGEAPDGLPRPTALAAVAAGLLLAAVPPADLQAQQQPRQRAESRFHPSPYLRLDHWAYDVLDYWIHTGRIENLSPLTRPWRRIEVARAIRHVADSRPYPYEQEWLARLRREFRHELDRLRGVDESEAYVRGRIELGGSWWTQTHRDPLRPELEGEFSDNELLERAFLELDGRAGPLVGAFYAGRDGFFTEDAQFPGGRVVPEKDADVVGLDELKARVQEAYVELQSEYARVSFGRRYRNWGPPGTLGVTRSDYAYSYDELAYRAGTDRVFLTGNVTELADARGDTTRYFTSHRLEARPAEELVLAVSEAAIHGGPAQSLDFTFVNPIGIWHLAQGGDDTSESGTPVNFVGQVDAWWRPARGFALYGSFLADATSSVGTGGVSCCQLGGMAGLELPGLVRGWRFRLQATSVQSLAYRTRLPWEEWSVDGLGLGRDKADFHLFTVEAQWLKRPGLVLRPKIDVQALGERSNFKGDLRPPKEELPGFPRVLAGDAELTVRPAVAGRWRPAVLEDWALDLQWDLGVNVIRDVDHRPGDDRTEFVGRVRAVVETPEALLKQR